MTPEADAHDALMRLAQGDPSWMFADLGLDDGAAGVRHALGHLRATLANERRPDLALELFRARLHADLPTSENERRAALLTMMAAHGEARRHVRVPFDGKTVALVA